MQMKKVVAVILAMLAPVLVVWLFGADLSVRGRTLGLSAMLALWFGGLMASFPFKGD